MTKTSLSTQLTEVLEIEHPILLAPMGGIAGGRLAAAVTDAGGLGFIGGGYAEPAWLEREIELAAGSRVGIGFITFSLDERPDSLRVALETEPPAIQLSFGDPRPYVDQIRDAGALFIVQVQTLADAAHARDAGADVIIAQGQDAGGHGRSARGTMGLVPAVVDLAGPIPVVAAGGIADGRGLAAALMLGASGIALGTRLYATTEAISDPEAAALLEASGGDDTIRTSVFDQVRGPNWPAQYDARALRNRLVDNWHDRPDELAASLDQAIAQYAEAADDGYTVRPLWVGEGLDLIHTVEPTATVISEVIAQAVAELKNSSRYLSSVRHVG